MSLSIIDGRMINKISTTTGEVPTIAPSSDHTDGTWSKTDIYEGEIFINVADNKVYTRAGRNILEFSTTILTPR